MTRCRVTEPISAPSADCRPIMEVDAGFSISSSVDSLTLKTKESYQPNDVYVSIKFVLMVFCDWWCFQFRFGYRVYFIKYACFCLLKLLQGILLPPWLDAYFRHEKTATVLYSFVKNTEQFTKVRLMVFSLIYCSICGKNSIFLYGVESWGPIQVWSRIFDGDIARRDFLIRLNLTSGV